MVATEVMYGPHVMCALLLLFDHHHHPPPKIMLLTAKLNKNDDDVNLTTLYFRELPFQERMGIKKDRPEEGGPRGWWANGHTVADEV